MDDDGGGGDGDSDLWKMIMVIGSGFLFEFFVPPLPPPTLSD
jgi:hypothetical protein